MSDSYIKRHVSFSIKNQHLMVNIFKYVTREDLKTTLVNPNSTRTLSSIFYKLGNMYSER